MLFGACIIAIVGSFILAMIFDSLMDLFAGITTIGIVGAIVCLLFIVGGHVGAGAKVERIEQDRIAIEAKIQSGIFTDEFGIQDKLIFDEIKSYNKTIINGKYYQRNFWVGIFVPNIYDDFELIEYDIIPARE